MSHALKRALTLAVFVVALGAGPAPAADLDAVRAMVQDGRYAQALERIDEALAGDPGDVQARFLRGVVLAELGRTDNAITVFRRLAEDLPEMPEPHNNLAVLYAGRGDYDRARDALLDAIHTHPSYATAHENLGDVYAKLASVAYDKALRFDGSNASVRSKLSLIDEFLSVASDIPASDAGPAAPGMVSPASAAVSPPPPAVPDLDALLPALTAWSRAWSAADVGGYLASYATSFVPPRGLSRAAWERERRIRLTKPRSIEVGLSDVRASFGNPGEADVTFTQTYRSDLYEDEVLKRLRFAWEDGRWKIIAENEVQ